MFFRLKEQLGLCQVTFALYAVAIETFLALADEPSLCVGAVSVWVAVVTASGAFVDI